MKAAALVRKGTSGLIVALAALMIPQLLGCSPQAAAPGAGKESSFAIGARLNEPRILIEKGKRTLTLFDGETALGSCPIGLGTNPEGDKTREGDGRTPVGDYYVCSRNPQSRYHLSLGLSYPSVKDADRALGEGRIDEATHARIIDAIGNMRRPPWDTPLGGEIMIHGRGSGSDWTLGCIAVDDPDMDVLFESLPLGTPVTIKE